MNQCVRAWWFARALILAVLVCGHDDARTLWGGARGAAGDDFQALYHRDVSAAAARGLGAGQALDSPNCRARIASPSADEVWTASYLIVQWRLCPVDEMAASSVVVRIDGQEMTRGHPGAGRFTVHGIANGWHTVEVVVLDDQGAALDLGAGMVVRFQVERGESLLGSMAKRVEAGEFGELDAQPPRGDGAGESGQVERGGVVCSEEQDFTLVTAALNIGRRHGNISFENDYIGNLRHILSLGCPVVLHLQQQYVPMIEPFLHQRASIRIKEIADLEAFKHAAAIEALRTSNAWAGQKKAYNPAKMQHYNALVNSKLYWLAEVAQENPYQTQRFLWMDAGLCVRFVAPPLQLADANDSS